MFNGIVKKDDIEEVKKISGIISILWNYQIILPKLCSSKYLLHFEKCFEPKKPLYADNGDGCADIRIKLCLLSINFKYFFGWFPHKIKTIFLFFLPNSN